MRLSIAANTIIPAIQLLKELGYNVTVSASQNSEQVFTAERGGNIFVADDPVAVLGLVKLYESKGEHWQVSDGEWNAIGREYGLF